MLDPKRRSEIIEILFMDILREQQMRIRSAPDFNREIKNLAKKTGIPEAEIREVLNPIITQLVKEMVA